MDYPSIRSDMDDIVIVNSKLQKDHDKCNCAMLNSSPCFLCYGQGITTASLPPPMPSRLDLMVRGYLHLAPSPLSI